MKLDWEEFQGWDHTLTTDLIQLQGWFMNGSATQISGWEGFGKGIRNPDDVRYNFETANVSGLVVGFKFKPTSIGVDKLVIRISLGAELRIEESGLLYWRLNPGVGPPDFISTGSVLVTGTWYNIEYGLYVGKVNGFIKIKRDGIDEPGLSQTGLDTQQGGNAYVNQCGFATDSADFDDFWIRTGSQVFGIDNDDFFSDTNNNPRVKTLWPNGQGFYDSWTPTPLGGTHFEKVNETLLDEGVTFLNVAGSIPPSKDLKDSWTFNNPSGNVVQLFAIKTAQFTSTTTGGNFDYFLRVNDTDHFGGTVLGGGVTYETGGTTQIPARTRYWKTNPDTGLPWTIDELTNIQLGIKKIENPGSVSISQAVVYYVYSAQAGGGGDDQDPPGDDEGAAPAFNLEGAASKSFILLDFIKEGSTEPISTWKLTNANMELTTKYGLYQSDPSIKVKLPTNSIGDLKRQIATIDISVDPRFLFAQELTSRRAVHPITVLVREREHTDTEDRTTLRFVGSVYKAIRNPSGREDIIRISVGEFKNDLDSSAGISENRICAWVFGNTKTCDLDGAIQLEANLGEQGDLTLANLVSTQVNIQNLGVHPNTYWRRGFVRFDNQDIRIRHWESGESFFLSKYPPLSWDGKEVTVFPGCDKRAATCEFWQNLNNFRGLAIAAPARHPVFETTADA